MIKEKQHEKKRYNTPKVELIRFDDTDLILTSGGNGNVGISRYGSGCQGVPYHEYTRTFSSNKNSGC